MKSVIGIRVTNIIRETDNGHFVAELADHSLGCGFPWHVFKTFNIEERANIVSSTKRLSTDDFETYIEALWCSK